MGVKSKLVSQMTIYSRADVFKLYQFPSHFTKFAPELVPKVALLDGEMGKVGLIIFFIFNQGGKKLVTKMMVVALDEKNKSITYRMIGGDHGETFDSLEVTIESSVNGQVDTLTEGIRGDLEEIFEPIVVTIEIGVNGLVDSLAGVGDFKKKSEDVPDPHEFMKIFLQLNKEIERNNDVLVHN